MSFKARPNRRQRWMGASLAATLVAVAWAATLDQGSTDAAVVQAIGFAHRVAPAPEAFGAQVVKPGGERSPNTRMPWREAAPDELLAWGAGVSPQAAPPSPVPTPSAADVAPAPQLVPPFPYQLFGRLEEGGKARAMLMSSEGTLVVQVGDLIDTQWRVERIDADGLGLIWLPAQQALNVHFKAS